MKVRTFALVALAAGLVTSAATAADQPEAAAPATPATAVDESHAKAPQEQLGEREYKERINLVARKPRRIDIEYIDSRDRGSWNEFTDWQGVRDERPIIARKVIGFHSPRPHRPRAERVLLIGRGPLRGPAPTE